MSILSILHVTDFHIENPSGMDEQLREGFYKDYIVRLFNKIESKFQEKVDFLVCTGDIIHKGVVANFDHADKIFKYIGEKGSIPKENIFINIGNHDLVVLSNDNGDRTRFDKFVADNSKQEIVGDSLHWIEKVDNSKVCFCLLDSIFNQEKKINADVVTKMIYPSVLSQQKLDEIVNTIDDSVPSDYLLIICCHFPMIVSPQSEMYTEQDGWIEKHIWKSGKAIAKRIIERRSKSKTFFLFGDGHLPDFWQESASIQFFMTGMFGGNYVHNTYIENGETRSYNKTNQARLFRFNSDQTVESITTYNYEPEGFKIDMQASKWNAADSTNPPIRKSDITVPNIETIVPTTSTLVPTQDQNRLLELVSATTVPIDLIASHIQTEILTEIRNRHLYTIARTASSNNESSLGWLPINLLFKKTELLARCIDRGYEWINSKSPNMWKYEDSVIIGIGFWGAIIGAQLSVRLGIRNYCIASNLSGHKNSKYESLDNLCAYLAGKDSIERIVVVTDVISTGNSICKIKKNIEEKCGIKGFWCAISVIADKRQERSANISEYNILGSFCTELAIPIVKNELLPDESIFPIEYDYR